MIDIHCHIIPYTDDGPKDIEGTVNMGKKAQDAGYNGIIATSHYIIHDIENDYNEYRKRIDDINKTFEENDIKVKIYYGNEIFFTNGIVDLLKNKKVSSLADSKYVLFEFPLYNNKMPMNAFDEINALQDAGYIPILAHPERYSYVEDNLDILIPLIEAGVLIQSNIGNAYGKYGKKAQKTFKKMLQNNMINFLATDSHNTQTYESEEESLKKIRKWIKDDEKLDIILSNPEKIIKNEKIDIFEIKR